MNPLVVVAVVLLAPAVFDITTRGSFRRLALRNIARRKGEAALVILGSLLGTAIITASFIVGDTFDASLRDIARTRLGPVDEEVRIEGLDGLSELEAAIGTEPLAGSDGVLRAVSSGAAVSSVADEPRAEPTAGLAEYDFEAARAFGDDPASTGLADAGPTPAGSEALIDERLADTLGVSVGDQIEVHAFAASQVFTVRHVLDEVGLAGGNVLVEPGTIAALAAASPRGSARPPVGQVLVSNDGGVFDGAAGTEAMLDQLEARIGGVAGAEIVPVKADLLDEAESAGDGIGSLFSAIGGFSVIAGVLLLVNLFVIWPRSARPSSVCCGRSGSNATT